MAALPTLEATGAVSDKMEGGALKGPPCEGARPHAAPATTNHSQRMSDITQLSIDIPLKKTNRDTRKSEESLKFLNNLNSVDQKLAALSKKYTDMVEENRKYHMMNKHWDRKYAMMQREKDQMQLEFNKTVLIKSKLENLCRELQKQIKAVKDDSIQKIKEEEDRRKETLTLFQNTITDLTAAVQTNNEKNNKLRDDNQDMTEKFKSVMEQYELREHQVDKISKQMALEAQLSEARLTKASLEAQAEKEKLLAEKRQLLVQLTQYQGRCSELQATEVALRSQIAMYTDKYDEFQNALKKSNEVFGGFKGEMDKMSKKVEKQEKEALSWKGRWEKSLSALMDMAAEKQQTESSFALQSRQLSQLQRLCRTMQAERTILLNTLRDNNIERPPLPQLPPEPKVANEGVDRVDLMAANCAQLKQSLSQLQGRLNDLTAKKELDLTETKPAETTVVKKSKKGKGKKGKGNQADSAKETDDAVSENNTNESTTDDASKLLDILEMDPLSLPVKCPFNIAPPILMENGVADCANDEPKEIAEPPIVNGGSAPEEESPDGLESPDGSEPPVDSESPDASEPLVDMESPDGSEPPADSESPDGSKPQVGSEPLEPINKLVNVEDLAVVQ